MSACLVYVAAATVLLYAASSKCPLKKKKLQKTIRQYQIKCLDKGVISKLGRDSKDKKPNRKVVKRCTKMERKLKKCGYKCERDMTLRATCDNIMRVYVDGTEREATGTSDWKKESMVRVSSSFKVLAIECTNLRSSHGILASLQDSDDEYVLVTDGSWRCSSEEEKGWMKPNFGASSGNWQPADIIGPHMRMWPWIKIGQRIKCKLDLDEWTPPNSLLQIQSELKRLNVFDYGQTYAAEDS